MRSPTNAGIATSLEIRSERTALKGLSWTSPTKKPDVIPNMNTNRWKVFRSRYVRLKRLEKLLASMGWVVRGP